MRFTRSFRRRALRRAATTVGAVLAVGAMGAVPATAATRVPCVKHAGEVARSAGAALWVEGDRLLGCAPAVRSRFPELRAKERARISLGPWSTGRSLVSLRGVSVVWTDGQSNAGAPSATAGNLWAFDLRERRPWMRRISPAPPATFPAAPESKDLQVVAVRAQADIAAWVTAGGAVLLKARKSSDELNEIGIGGTLLGASAGGEASAGLVAEDALVETNGRVVAGRWPGHVDALASTLRIGVEEFVGDGSPDGTVCSVEIAWGVTVRPVAGLRRVGAKWAAETSQAPSDCHRPSVD